MKHLDLFSGIGGFALAAEWAFEDVEHVFCDFEPFAQSIIKKHWPNSQIHGDIRQLTADSISCGHVHRELEKHSAEAGEQALGQSSTACGRFEVDILTGGFPCQPFSQAGRRRGTEDDRHLWPEMLRVIRETTPRWVIGENVSGLLTWNEGLVFEQVCTDLENEGYEVQSFIIPAVSVNAPHRRDRVWIVAHAKPTGAGCESGTTTDEGGRTSKDRRAGVRQTHRAASSDRIEPTDTDDTNNNNTGLEGTARQSIQRAGARFIKHDSGQWNKNWLEVATELCTLDDGLRYDVVGLDGRRNAEKRPRPKGWRSAALKGAGNAIVPQVAYQIMLAIKSVDDVL